MSVNHHPCYWGKRQTTLLKSHEIKKILYMDSNIAELQEKL